MRRRVYRPTGDRVLHELVKETDKAMQFRYYSWLIWVPKFTVTKLKSGEYTAPGWAVSSGKKHPSAQHINIEEWQYQRELERETEPKHEYEQ